MLIKSAPITNFSQLTFIFICCHFNICIKFIVNQQVKRPQMMTAVTGKFVLKCCTANILTLFDISLFYVYKFYIISNHTGISRILLPSPWGRSKGEGLLVMCYVLFFIFHPPLHRSIHNLLHAV